MVIVAEAVINSAAIDLDSEELALSAQPTLVVDQVPAYTMCLKQHQMTLGVEHTPTAQVNAARALAADVSVPWLLCELPPHFGFNDRLGLGSATQVFAVNFHGDPAVMKKALPKYIAREVQAYVVALTALCQKLSSPYLVPVLGSIVASDMTALIVPRHHLSLTHLLVEQDEDNPDANTMPGMAAVPAVSPKDVALSIVNGLQVLQRAGLCHGKLSLSNVLFTDNPRSAVALTDYALMPLHVSAQTMTGASHVYYMAPELLRGDPVSIAPWASYCIIPNRKTDIFLPGLRVLIMGPSCCLCGHLQLPEVWPCTRC